MAESGLSGLRPDTESPASGASRRAQAIAQAGGVAAALAEGLLPQRADLELAEALVLGLLRLGVRRYVGVFGHGSTQLGEAVLALVIEPRRGKCAYQCTLRLGALAARRRTDGAALLSFG